MVNSKWSKFNALRVSRVIIKAAKLLSVNVLFLKERLFRFKILSYI